MGERVPFGRGSRLREKMKSLQKESSSATQADKPPLEAESSPSSSAVVQPSSSADVQPSSSEKPSLGRGHLLARMKRLSQKSESEEMQISKPEVGISTSEPKAFSGKAGRGAFLKEITKQSKKKSLAAPGVPDASVRQGERKEVQEEEQKKAQEAEEQVLTKVSEVTKQVQQISLQREEEIEDKPVIRRGEMGQPITVAVNYVTLRTDPGKGVFEYDVKFIPEVEYIAFRYRLINEHFKTNNGIRCYDGTAKLYLPEKTSSDKVIIDAKHPVDKTDVQIILTFIQQMKPKECGQFYNILLNNCSKALKLTRLGKQYFDYSAGHSIPQHKLEVWPGYVTSVEEFEGGIHLCCDIRHRVLRMDTAYEILSNLAKASPSNFKTLAMKELLGQCVLTRYNNNMYRIDDINWDQTPLSTFKLNTGEDITFVDYYKKQYNVEIRDLKQPLLINKPKSRKSENPRLVCLVPELCNLTGLTDKMKRDMKVMKEIALYTRVTPAQRHFAFKKFLENLRSNARAQEMLKNWGLKIEENPVEMGARILTQEDIILKNKLKYATPINMEWSKYIRSNGVFRGMSVSHWVFIHTKRDGNLARSFVNMLIKVGPGLGIEISHPVSIALSDDRIDSYIKAIRDSVTTEVQLIICLCPTPREDRYSAIKKLCCRDLPIPSQVVNCPTVAKENRMRAVVQNIALQINNKVGGASWAINIPMRNTMICGIDSYHDPWKKNYSVGAFVASVDAEFTQWFSKACVQEPKQELLDGLVCCFALALRKYMEINNVLPDRVIIFRDGVGDGQLSLVKEYEVVQFLETCSLVSKSYRPKFSFIVVQKRINTKIYQLSNGSGTAYENPRAGCVVDHTINRRNFYDFFLVSQYVSCGTATPSHYIVLYDTSELKPDLMQRLTYKCCHMYYNWAGTIRVPAPCQYAHKLAYLVGQNIKELPKDVLDDKLFYL